MALKQLAQDLCPPMMWRALKAGARTARGWGLTRVPQGGTPDQQALGVYWDAKMAEALETWGEGNAWREVQYFLSLCKGRVLDIACGTGRVLALNSRFDQLELYGCDISDFLIGKAIERGLDPGKLQVCDATATGYPTGFFDFAYSIGSLEHFTEQGIDAFLGECSRVTSTASFHHIPTSRGQDQGWITPYQSYFNNSVSWWLPRFERRFHTVHVIDSSWSDDLSVGKWFVCLNGSSGQGE